MSDSKGKETIDRRDFLRSTAVVGAGLALSQPLFAAESKPKKPDDINVALLGAGAQGQVLMNATLKIGPNSGIRFKAVCDIWTKNSQRRASRQLKSYGHPNNPYVDYREMLDKEKDLDAVIVATPDFWHAEHAIECMKAGLHVYCEKEMSNTLENARKMVETAKETGKLLQIGHQRRSNPRYIYCYEKLIKEAGLLGPVTIVNGQWNRSKAACLPQELKPNIQAIDAQTLNKYGFESMKQFLNWRWYKGKGGGPIVDLGSHQIDIFSWFLEAHPKSVMASGGTDYWTGNEWYDNVIAIYEYETKKGTVRATYRTGTTNSTGGYFEHFMGDEGTLEISEPTARGGVFRESWVPEKKWYPWEKKRYIKRVGGLGQQVASKSVLDVRSTPLAAKYNILVEMNQPFHQPHLLNFFDSIRGKATLNCPGKIGYETAVSVLKVNEAVEAGCRLEFKPEEFEV